MWKIDMVRRANCFPFEYVRSSCTLLVFIKIWFVILCFKSFICSVGLFVSFCLWFNKTLVLFCSQGGVLPLGFWSATEPGLRSRHLLIGVSVVPWGPCLSRTCWRGMKEQTSSIPCLTITPILNRRTNTIPNIPHSTWSSLIPICTLCTHSKKADLWN